MQQSGGWTYILASRQNGTLYTDATCDLLRRVCMHKHGTASHFTNKYGVTSLVWYEAHHRMETAVQRKNSIKRWHRTRKLELIQNINPEWIDLFDVITALPCLPHLTA